MNMTKIRRRASAVVEDVRENVKDAAVQVKNAIDQAHLSSILNRLDTLRIDPPAWSFKQFLILIVILGCVAGGFAWYFYHEGWNARGADFEVEKERLVARARAEDRVIINRLNMELELARRMVMAAQQRAADADERAEKAVNDLLLHGNNGADITLAPDMVETLNRMIREVNK
jgi:hypothetical protein